MISDSLQKQRRAIIAVQTLTENGPALSGLSSVRKRERLQVTIDRSRESCEAV